MNSRNAGGNRRSTSIYEGRQHFSIYKDRPRINIWLGTTFCWKNAWPGYVIISATPRHFSTSSNTINYVLDMSKCASHLKSFLPVEALGIIWTTGGISNLRVRLSGSASLLWQKPTFLFVGCVIKAFLEIDRVCIFSAQFWCLRWLWSGNAVACGRLLLLFFCPHTF